MYLVKRKSDGLHFAMKVSSKVKDENEDDEDEDDVEDTCNMLLREKNVRIFCVNAYIALVKRKIETELVFFIHSSSNLCDHPNT